MKTPGLAVVKPEEGPRFEVFGSVTLFKATAESTGGAFSVLLETTAPNGGLPLHVHHREDEAMYILEGEYEIQCGDRVFKAGAGTFVFLPRNTPNRYTNLGDAPGKFLQIICPGGFESVVAQTSEVFSSGPPDFAKIAAIGQKHGVEFV